MELPHLLSHEWLAIPVSQRHLATESIHILDEGAIYSIKRIASFRLQIFTSTLFVEPHYVAAQSTAVRILVRNTVTPFLGVWVGLMNIPPSMTVRMGIGLDADVGAA